MGLLTRLLSPRGEMSPFRDSYGRKSAFRYSGDYQLNSSRVDYELARDLYRNRHDDYKLGAWCAKPVINTTAGFMGVPHFIHGDPEADGALEEAFGQWTGIQLRISRNWVRDGDVFARLDMEEDRFDPRVRPELKPRLLRPEWCTPIYDPLTGNLSELIIRHPVLDVVKDPNGKVREQRQYHIIETLKPRERTIEADRDAPPGKQQEIEALMTDEERRNPWGFIPVVQFKNEAEEDELFGFSELEPIEPFMRAYHDTMLYALEGAKLFARPKAQFSVRDVDQFIANNFSEEEIKAGRLRFADKEIFFMKSDAAGQETAEFITADSGITGTTTLLEFLFYCIVDVSETPEFAFGTAVASSKASVSEQMPVLSRKIRRKREDAEDQHKELATMYLAMSAQVNNRSYDTYRVREAEWEEVSPKDDAQVATTLSTFIGAMGTGVNDGLFSLDAAVDFLREYMPSILPFTSEGNDDDEKARIAASKLFLQRLEAGVDEDEDEPASPPHLRLTRGGAA